MDELAHGGNTVNDNVDDVRTSRGNGLVRRHGDGEALSLDIGLEALVVKEDHAMTHVDRVGNVSTVVERDLDVLGVGGSIELDVKGRSNLGALVGDDHVGRTGGVALEVGRSVDLVAELSDERVLGAGLEDGLLNGVGTSDEKSTVKEKESDTVVETGNGGLGASGEALALGLVGVVKEDLKSGVTSDTETLGTLLTTVNPDNSTVRKKSSLNHTTAFGHRVHLPLWVSIKGPDAAARGVSGGSDVLVRTATADDDIRVVVVGAGQGKHDGTTGVGVSAVGTGEISKLADNGTSLNLEDLSGLGDLDEDIAIFHQVHEGVHVVGLVLAEDLHVVALATGGTVSVEDLIGGVVVLGLARVEAVLGSGCNEDGVVGHDLDGGVPTGSVELGARLVPVLSVHGAISLALKESHSPETITDGGVNEVKRSVTTERSEAAISKEDTTGAESVGLVGEGNLVAGGRVPFGRVGILAIGELQFSVVLDLVKEDNTTVGHETSVHNRDTRAALKRNASRFSGSRRRAGSGGGDARSLVAGSALATLTAVSGCVTTVTVHAAAAALGPVAADSVTEPGSTASIGGGNASGLGSSSGGMGLTKNRLAGGGGGRRTADSRLGERSSLRRGGVTLAAVLASVGLEAVTVGLTAVSVRRAATTKGAVGIAGCAAKVLSATAVVPSLGAGGLGYRGLGSSGLVVAARLARLAAVGGSRAAPAVLRAAGSRVDGAVGVAEQVAVLRTALTVLRVLGSLALGGNNAERRAGGDFGVGALVVRDTAAGCWSSWLWFMWASRLTCCKGCSAGPSSSG